MQPHASRTRADSSIMSESDNHVRRIDPRVHRKASSSAEGKALPALPPLQTSTTSPRTPTSPNTFSPSVKRKPLPSSALSPTFPIPQIQHIPESSQGSGVRAIAPPSSNVLNQVLTAPAVEVDVESNHSDDPQSYYFSASPASEAPGRDSIDDFPRPPAATVQQKTFNEAVVPEESEKSMGLKPGERPPPLRMDSVNKVQILDARKPASPGSKFTSFFSRKPQASPGADSAVTDISDGRSPMPSPYPQSDRGSANSGGVNSYFGFGLGRSNTAGSSGSERSMIYPKTIPRSTAEARCNVLEAELKEISVELATSIRRELDLEDIVERLQSDNPYPISADRTSDYFSDSGTSLSRSGPELNTKDEIDKIKRETEQQRAQIKLDLSQKWQGEMSQRKTLENHVEALEEQLGHLRRATEDSAGSSTRAKELEFALNDAQRRLQEERQVKENFEDLLQALRSELETHRSQRDNLRDEIVPQLRARVEGLELTLAETQRSQYDVTKLQQEVQHLRDENAALMSAREMERGINNRGSMQFIAEEDYSINHGSMMTPRIGGLSRSNTLTGGRGNRGSLARSGSLSRANSTGPRGPQTVDSIENAVEKLKAAEQQRDALHTTVKYLLTRQDQQRKQFRKRAKILESELDRAQNAFPAPRKGGYEREVRVLRAEINTLRKRADDALDQKWQCEKNLAGLKMDLDRNKQETASLQKILQAKGSDPDIQGLMSTSLENAIIELQKERARVHESSSQIQQEERLSEQLEEYANRSEALAAQVKRQLQNNSSLRARLKNAVALGEDDQKKSAEQINELQNKLRKLEDSISAAQIQSETAVMKHEEEVRVINASHNSQLMRSGSTSKNANLLQPAAKSPLSPMFANSKRSPRLDKTSSGPGMALHEALRTEYLENKVTDLERALADTETEISQIVGKMNEAQVSVAELEAERDEALRLTRKLEAAVQTERTKYGELIKTMNEW